MPGRIFIPWDFDGKENPRETDLAYMDDTVVDNVKQLMGSRCTNSFCYIGGTGNRSLNSVKDDEELYIVAHINLTFSCIQIGGGIGAVYLTGQELANILAKEKLSKNIRHIKIFACMSASTTNVTAGVQYARRFLRGVKDFDALILKEESKKSAQQKINSPLEEKAQSRWTMLSLSERKKLKNGRTNLTLIDNKIAQLTLSRKEFATATTAKMVADYGWYHDDYSQLTDADKAQHFVPFGMELAMGLADAGYRHTVVRAYLGYVSCFHGTIQIEQPITEHTPEIAKDPTTGNMVATGNYKAREATNIYRSNDNTEFRAGKTRYLAFQKGYKEYSTANYVDINTGNVPASASQVWPNQQAQLNQALQDSLATGTNDQPRHPALQNVQHAPTLASASNNPNANASGGSNQSQSNAATSNAPTSGNLNGNTSSGSNQSQSNAASNNASTSGNLNGNTSSNSNQSQNNSTIDIDKETAL